MRPQMPTGFSEALQQAIHYRAGSGDVAPNHAYHTASADFDGDGNDDLIISSRDSIILFAKGLGNGAFESPFTTITEGTELISHGKLLCRSGIAVGDFNGDSKPDISITGFIGNCPTATNSHIASKTFTFLNTMEWPTAAPLITETSTTDTSTTSVTTTTTGTESSTTGTMFELVTGTTVTESSTTETPMTNDGLVQENADLLARVDELAGRLSQLENNQNTYENISNFGENNRKASISMEIGSMAVSAVALIGTIALALSMRSQQTSPQAKAVEIDSIAINNGFADSERDVYVDMSGTSGFGRLDEEGYQVPVPLPVGASSYAEVSSET